MTKEQLDQNILGIERKLAQCDKIINGNNVEPYKLMKAYIDKVNYITDERNLYRRYCEVLQEDKESK